MEVRVYLPIDTGHPAFVSVGRITGATAVTVVERLYTPGYFEIQVPTAARHAEKLEEGCLVWIDGGAWGIVDSIHLEDSSSGDLLTASGRELKGLMADRITIPPDFNAVTGAQGYDTVTGSTESCMKHYVAANCCNEAQPARVLYGLEIAQDQERGIAEDKYMSRHDSLDSVLQDLGEAAELGYEIIPDLTQHRFVFDVVAGEDHTSEQSERMRVIFDIDRKTALSQVYDHDTGDSRNVFYTTMDGAEFVDEALTVTYIREGETEACGIRRREAHLSISAETPVAGDEYNELRRLALIEAEQYRPAESFTCEIAEGPYRYRKDFRLGDVVTCRNRRWGIVFHARVTEMQTAYSSSGIKHTATFGSAPLGIFGRLKRQIKKGS